MKKKWIIRVSPTKEIQALQCLYLLGVLPPLEAHTAPGSLHTMYRERWVHKNGIHKSKHTDQGPKLANRKCCGEGWGINPTHEKELDA